MSAFFELLGYLGAAIGVAMVLPQVQRVLRHPGLGGVAPLSWGLMSVCCLLWILYGVRHEQPVQIFGNILLVAGAVTVCLAAENPVPARRRALLLGVAMATAFAVGMTIPAASVGYVAFGLGLFSMVPQVVASIRTYQARETSGISLPSFGLRVASQACWLTFAIGTHDGPVVVAATVALSTALLVLILERAARSDTAFELA